MAIVPLKQLIGRPPEHGRLRFGEKVMSRGGKQIPKATDTWIFTSPDLEAIKALATQHGGSVERWVEPKANPRDQWKVHTEANTIDVWLPQDSLTCNYECWSGDGIQRRCDGELCTNHTPLGKVETPCVCIAENLKPGDRKDPACKPHTRVNVVIPDIPFGGVWRLEVKGETFMHEAPGMVAILEQIHQRAGFARVKLALTSRQAIVNGQLSHFIVPQFFSPNTAAEMLEGLSMVGPGQQLGPAPVGELGTGAIEAEVLDPTWDTAEDDDDVEDAVIVEFPSRRPPADEPEGWDERPKNVAVRLNPDPNGPKWVRKR